jgi:hypothetical protein
MCGGKIAERRAWAFIKARLKLSCFCGVYLAEVGRGCVQDRASPKQVPPDVRDDELPDGD